MLKPIKNDVSLRIILYICSRIINMVRMLTRKECINKLKSCKGDIISKFGVTSLYLFGSVARNEQNESSDIDICVEMQPNLLKRSGLKLYLEQLLGCNVDVLRQRKGMDVNLQKQIEHDGILVFR